MNQKTHQKLRIYLAGKITKNGWRNEILENNYGYLGNPSNMYKWEPLEAAIFGVHDYVGPFFIGDDHGSMHGKNRHGLGAYKQPEERIFSVGFNDFVGLERSQIAQKCKTAINRANFIFAWLDAPDAYGTLFELAFADAKGKPIYISSPPNFKYREDMWFFETLADSWLTGSTPRDCLIVAIEHHYQSIAETAKKNQELQNTPKAIAQTTHDSTFPDDPIARKWNYTRDTFEPRKWVGQPASDRQLWYINKLITEKPHIANDMLHLIRLHYGDHARFKDCTKGAAAFIISAFLGENKRG